MFVESANVLTEKLFSNIPLDVWNIEIENKYLAFV